MRMPRQRSYNFFAAWGFGTVIAGADKGAVFLAGMVKKGIDQRKPCRGIEESQGRKPYRLLHEAF
jgi:hypothetical protein